MRGRSKGVIGVAEGPQQRNEEGRSGDPARRMNLRCGVADQVSLGRRAGSEARTEGEET
jgi:hypothetical protein